MLVKVSFAVIWKKREWNC